MHLEVKLIFIVGRFLSEAQKANIYGLIGQIFIFMCVVLIIFILLAIYQKYTLITGVGVHRCSYLNGLPLDGFPKLLC